MYKKYCLYVLALLPTLFTLFVTLATAIGQKEAPILGLSFRNLYVLEAISFGLIIIGAFMPEGEEE